MSLSPQERIENEKAMKAQASTIAASVGIPLPHLHDAAVAASFEGGSGATDSTASAAQGCGGLGSARGGIPGRAWMQAALEEIFPTAPSGQRLSFPRILSIC